MQLHSTLQKSFSFLIGILIIATAFAVTFFHKNIPVPSKQTVIQPSIIPSSFPLTSPLPTIDEKVLNTMSTQCTFNNNFPGSTTAFIKHGKVHVVMISQQSTSELINNILFMNNIVYTWDDVSKKGTIIDLSKNPNTQFIANIKNNLVQQYMQRQNDCKEANISDDEFSIPQDITFTKSSDLLNTFQKIQ